MKACGKRLLKVWESGVWHDGAWKNGIRKGEPGGDSKEVEKD